MKTQVEIIAEIEEHLSRCEENRERILSARRWSPSHRQGLTHEARERLYNENAGAIKAYNLMLRFVKGGAK